MTHDELVKSISAMIAEGDNDVKTTAGNAIIDAFDALTASNVELTNSNTELTERNKKLNDANASLFLKTVGGKTETEEEEEEKTPRQIFNELFDAKYNHKGEEK